MWGTSFELVAPYKIRASAHFVWVNSLKARATFKLGGLLHIVALDRSCRSMPNHSLRALLQTSHFALSEADISDLDAKLLCASFDPDRGAMSRI